MGMAAASELGVLKGILDPREKERIETLLDAFGLPITIPPEYDRARIQEYLLTDKKTIGGKVFFVLPTMIGKVIITDEVDAELIAKVL
jgi:3-dehydroquinate synthase